MYEPLALAVLVNPGITIIREMNAGKIFRILNNRFAIRILLQLWFTITDQNTLFHTGSVITKIFPMNVLLVMPQVRVKVRARLHVKVECKSV